MKFIPLFWGAFLVSGGAHLLLIVLATGIFWKSPTIGAISEGGISMVDIEIGAVDGGQMEQVNPNDTKVDETSHVEKDAKRNQEPKFHDLEKPSKRVIPSNNKKIENQKEATKNAESNSGEKTALNFGEGSSGSGFLGDAGESTLGGGGEGVGAKVLYAPNPAYPGAARRAGFEGTTVLDIFIDSKGEVGDTKVLLSSGRNDCDESAVSTIRDKWRFSPAILNGKPSSSKYKIAVRYVLK